MINFKITFMCLKMRRADDFQRASLTSDYVDCVEEMF